MVVAAKLKTFLDERGVGYHVLKHHERFTSSEIAQALHVPGRQFAKVVIAKADGKLLMAVLSANRRLDLAAVAQAAGARRAELATEQEFKDAFPDCELGAMPPFGNLYGLPVYVDRELTEDEEIVFEAGNHREAVKLRFEDFRRLAEPTVATLATVPPVSPA